LFRSQISLIADLTFDNIYFGIWGALTFVAVFGVNLVCAQTKFDTFQGSVFRLATICTVMMVQAAVVAVIWSAFYFKAWAGVFF